MKRPNKYSAQKITYDGETFDSRKEFTRWRELLLMQKAGLISSLSRQVKFELIPTMRDGNGKVIERECSYIADFVYRENGAEIVEDCKGYRTEVYRLKRKLMLYVHGIRIRET